MALTKVTTGVTDLNQAQSTNGLKFPTGSVFAGTPEEGMIRNDQSQSSETSSSTMQFYNGAAWKNFVNRASGPTYPFDIDYLVVAGGGGGWWGAGGAGGFLNSTITASASNVLTITVGDKGLGRQSPPTLSTSGGNSSIVATGVSIIAIGGGAGGGADASQQNGLSGGSGGGGGLVTTNTSTVVPGSSGTSGQGNAGGSGLYQGTPIQGGGGGGAGAAGTRPNGGAGSITTIISTTIATAESVGEVSGTSVIFSGGGGGASRSLAAGTGGSGGGANGSVYPAIPTDALPNTGGGGGAYQGNGGSGVVILKLATINYTGTTTGSPTVIVDGSDTILIFKASGSYTS